MNTKDDFEKGVKKLKETKSLEEILKTASSFEQTARDFYTKLVPKVSKRIRWLVEELAEEEEQHYKLFTSLARKIGNDKSLLIKVNTPASDGKFTDCLHVPELGDSPDDQDVMLYALGREQAAMEQYQSLAESTEPGEIHDLFQYLANEETKHKAELEKLYYELTH